MCGIGGYVGFRRAAPIVVEMLRLLEYRGYDSVGVATMDAKGKIRISKGVGDIESVLKSKRLDALPGTIGIGHTRWSTHGKVSEENAHPHTDCTGRIALVHNGVIQNYLEVKRELESKGHEFRSETDTEVVAHLLEDLISSGLKPLEAIEEAMRRLQGNFSIALMISPHRRLFFMKRGLLPLIIGLGEREAYLASDVIALAPYTKRVVYLEDGDYGYISPEGLEIRSLYGPRRPKVDELNIDPSRIDKGGFAHRMHKEIYDIPHFSAMFVNYAEHHIARAIELLESYDRIRIIGAGSSYHASLYGEYVLSRVYRRKHFKAVIASEFPNRLDLVSEDDLVIAVSQSGETYDVLEPVRKLKAKGVKVLAIVNRRNSELDRIADERVYIEAGIEKAVAATKTFVNQTLAFASLAGKDLSKVPEVLDMVLKEQHDRRGKGKERLDETMKDVAMELKSSSSMFYLGRYLGFVTAKEGALKIKEVAYIHAEAYPSGELKHGPLALIEEGFPVVLISYSEEHSKKDLSTYEEVVSRGAKTFVFTLEGMGEEFENRIELPAIEEELAPIVIVLPLFLLAYHSSVLRGYNPDKPRNLAKSVTVE